ncbi:MAG TPA: hypothetical protein VF730_11845 [Terracidiphilus sp.]
MHHFSGAGLCCKTVRGKPVTGRRNLLGTLLRRIKIFLQLGFRHNRSDFISSKALSPKPVGHLLRVKKGRTARELEIEAAATRVRGSQKPPCVENFVVEKFVPAYQRIPKVA